MARGYSTQGAAELTDAEGWQPLVCESVGNFIEFWGFKRNHGRLWALLFLRRSALTAAEIQSALDLSKGAVSMVTRELERWGVIHRQRAPGSSAWRFSAETDLMTMIGRVLREREASLVSRVKADLERAEALARADPAASTEAVDRIARLRTMAALAEAAIELFLRTAQVDISGVVDALMRPARLLGRARRGTRK